jgi:hypothetical protein
MFNQGEAPLQNRAHAVLGDALFDLSGVAGTPVPLAPAVPPDTLQSQIDALVARVSALEWAALRPTRWDRIWSWIRRYWWMV